jgi:hypothetical protein
MAQVLSGKKQTAAMIQVLIFSQSAVRATFGAVFGTGGTKEFYCHESAEPEDVEAFIDEEGVGPVVKDLHFDMNAGKTSRWNQHAFSLLLEVLKSVIAEDDDQPSDTYLIGLIQNRFIRCRDVWRTAQAKPKEDGSVETADEVANRLIEQNSQMNAYRRQNTRRINVRDCIPSIYGPADCGLRGSKGETRSAPRKLSITRR